MTSPLQGTRILDLTRLIPGPLCTLILADLGAEVIKVEAPVTGDYERQIKPFQGGMAYRFMLLNRNKKSLCVNLKHPKGKQIFLGLIGQADVVVEGFRPGVMERLGLGYEELKKVNKGLIYCSLSSYGHTGPKKGKVAHDINILAETGILDLTGKEQNAPVIPGVQLVDAVTALYGVIGIQAGLSAREKTGEGQKVDLSMHDCAFSLVFDSIRYPLAEKRIPQRGKERLTGGLACYNVYETKDGKFLSLGALEKNFQDKLLTLLGVEKYIEKGGSVTTAEADENREEELKTKLKRIFKGKTLEEWKRILEKENVFFSPVMNVGETLEDEQLRSRQMIVNSHHPVAGPVVYIGSPIKMSETSVDVNRLPAPRLGEHTVEMLALLGMEEDAINKLAVEGVISV